MLGTGFARFVWGTMIKIIGSVFISLHSVTIKITSIRFYKILGRWNAENYIILKGHYKTWAEEGADDHCVENKVGGKHSYQVFDWQPAYFKFLSSSTFQFYNWQVPLLVPFFSICSLFPTQHHLFLWKLFL